MFDQKHAPPPKAAARGLIDAELRRRTGALEAASAHAVGGSCIPLHVGAVDVGVRREEDARSQAELLELVGERLPLDEVPDDLGVMLGIARL